jgi:mRNA interferase RelE/StbE
MSYEVKFRPEAIEDLKKLEKPVAQRILSKIRWLAENCELIDHKHLTGDLAGFFTRRVGDYRIVYLIDSFNQSVDICLIGHRKDIYKLN